MCFVAGDKKASLTEFCLYSILVLFAAKKKNVFDRILDLLFEKAISGLIDVA